VTSKGRKPDPVAQKAEALVRHIERLVDHRARIEKALAKDVGADRAKDIIDQLEHLSMVLQAEIRKGAPGEAVLALLGRGTAALVLAAVSGAAGAAGGDAMHALTGADAAARELLEVCGKAVANAGPTPQPIQTKTTFGVAPAGDTVTEPASTLGPLTASVGASPTDVAAVDVKLSIPEPTIVVTNDDSVYVNDETPVGVQQSEAGLTFPMTLPVTFDQSPTDDEIASSGEPPPPPLTRSPGRPDVPPDGETYGDGTYGDGTYGS
jgi:hypothetical protein